MIRNTGKARRTNTVLGAAAIAVIALCAAKPADAYRWHGGGGLHGGWGGHAGWGWRGGWGRRGGWGGPGIGIGFGYYPGAYAYAPPVYYAPPPANYYAPRYYAPAAYAVARPAVHRTVHHHVHKATACVQCCPAPQSQQPLPAPETQ